MEKTAASVQETPDKGVLLPRCIVCQQVPARGIAGGFKIRKAFICHHCEQEILNLDTGSPAYQQIINRLKQMFL